MLQLPGEEERDARIQRNWTLAVCLIGVAVLTWIYFMH
jgi:hypothetical protein